MSSINTTHWRRMVFLALICLSVGQAIYYYPKLPETVASHFGASGWPDGWMAKAPFLYVSVGTVVFVSALFLGISLAMRSMCRKPSLPAEAIDEQAAMKKLAGERMGENMASFMFWFGIATLILILTIFQMAIQANLSPNPVLRHAGLALIVYVVTLVLLGVPVVIRYRQFEKIWPSTPLPPDTWFPAKRFGWGWGLPCRWQGWAFIGGWLLGLGLGSVFVLRSSLPVLIVPFESMMVVVLLIVCSIKGEKPRWRWGD